jgi:hypothetical protein
MATKQYSKTAIVTNKKFGYDPQFIIVAGVRRPAGGSKVFRRVDCISETVVGDDGHITFHDLMVYDPHTDTLMQTEWFPKSQRIKKIEDLFSLTPEQALQHVWARANIRHHVAQTADAAKNLRMLSAKNVLVTNNKYQELVDRYGVAMDCQKAVAEWKAWFSDIAQFI